MSGRVLVLAVFIAWASFGGCGAFVPRSDSTNFYVLGALSELDLPGDKSMPGVGGKFSVGLGPIEFPGYLDRQAIVTRTSTNRLSFSETDRWAGSLAEGFSNVLGQNLAHLFKSGQIIQFPWQVSDAPDFQVKIEVLRFEGDRDQEAWLTARWTVIDKEKKIRVVRSSQLHRRAASLSSEDIVKAMSATLGDLSREIATTLVSFES